MPKGPVTDQSYRHVFVSSNRGEESNREIGDAAGCLIWTSDELIVQPELPRVLRAADGEHDRLTPPHLRDLLKRNPAAFIVAASCFALEEVAVCEGPAPGNTRGARSADAPCVSGDNLSRCPIQLY